MPGESRDTGQQSGPARPQNDSRANKSVSPVLYMLVMGPQGCGKSSFINLATGRSDCIISASSTLCTKYIRLSKASKWMNGNEFRFTDTPGFGNETVEDAKIFEMLVESFVHRGDREGPNSPRRVTGLVYIHSEDEPFRSRTSRTTIEMLVKVLGKRFLDRVTVLIRSSQKHQGDLSNYIPPQDSPLYPLYYHDIKPWTVAYEQDTQLIVRILEPYVGVHPRLVRLAAPDAFFQKNGNNWNSDIPRSLKEFFLADTDPSATAEQPNANTLLQLQKQEDELERLRNSIVGREKELEDLRSVHEIKLKAIQEEKEADKADHDLNLKSLYATIRNYKGEISELKSSLDSKIQELEELKEETDKSRSKNQLEIERLQEQLQDKSKEISNLVSEKDSAIKQLKDELQVKNEELMKLQQESDRKIQVSMNSARAKDNEALELKARVNGTVTKTAGRQGDEMLRLSEELRRTKAEYASLRSHIQLQENTEQADITTALADINRLVEEFAQSLSEHIEKHMESSPSGKAIRPRDLLRMFGPVGGEVASKVKQDAYVLFEYAVQATVCDQLYTHLFKPFHPKIADNQERNVFIMDIYGQMTHQEPQSISGRWRKDAFNSISRKSAAEIQVTSDEKTAHRLVTAALSTLLGKINGIQPNNVLKEHDRALVKVTTKAEELNQLLKGGVSILGDFQPVVFSFGEAFRPDYMSEISSKPKKENRPEKILATIELGLVKSYALGGRRKPEETVLRKATVFGFPG